MSERSIYGDHAAAYATFSEHSPPNCDYDRPAMLALAGDIRGKRVLELGCAAGVLTAQLVEHGAIVVALDREPRLVELARQRLGGSARIEVADLAQPWTTLLDSSFDVVIASLVLHYLEDWAPVLAEVHRCLVSGGVLVFSIHHPITGWLRSERTDYHRTELITENWDWDGQLVTARMYRRPLSAIFGPVREAGFILDVIDEPRPAQIRPEIAPTLAAALTFQPVFLYVRAISTPPSRTNTR